jgi:hypothetical protein
MCVCVCVCVCVRVQCSAVQCSAVHAGSLRVCQRTQHTAHPARGVQFKAKGMREEAQAHSSTRRTP